MRSEEGGALNAQPLDMPAEQVYQMMLQYLMERDFGDS
jgi:hypothetical protein